MKKKLVLGTVIAILIVAILVGIITVLSINTKSKNIKLDTNYKAIIGIKVNTEVILVINQKDKVSNIIYLNEESVKTLANQKIEGKDIPTTIELIVDKLKNSNEFNNGSELELTKYEDNSLYTTVLQELNKEFVVYGVDNKIIENSNDIQTKLNELNITTKDDIKENLISLDNYSKKLLSK